jgi:hypothetical protein
MFCRKIFSLHTCGEMAKIFCFLRNVVVVLLLTLVCSQTCWAREVEWLALGVRGGENFQNAGLPPGEKEDFEQFDVFAIMGLPWGGKISSGWDWRWRLGISAGALRGAKDTAFITTLTSGPAFRIPDWRLILDAGVGGALLSKWEFGQQDIGGPFQFIAHGGIGFQLPWKMVIGWRFHHMSDATLYGPSRGVDLHMLEVSYYF